MRWFKFLAPGATGPFSGYRWPLPPTESEPGDWTATSQPLEPCRAGLHLCRATDLSLWLNAELYAVEADGPVVEYESFVLTHRARLLRRIWAWTPDVARRFCVACAWQVRGLTVHHLHKTGQDAYAERLARCTGLDDLARAAEAVHDADPEGGHLAGYTFDAATFAARVPEAQWATSASALGLVAATAAREAAGPGLGAAAMREERRRQAHWLAQHLALPEGAWPPANQLS